MTDGLYSNLVYSLSFDKSGNLLVGTSGGLNMIMEGAVRSIPFTENLQITQIETDAAENIWMATERGVARINLLRNNYELFSSPDGLPTLEITSLCFDKEGSLWLSSSKAGLLRLKDTGIFTFTTLHGLSSDLLNVIKEAPDGKIYIGNDGGDVDVWTERGSTTLELINAPKNVSIRDILFDGKGFLWIASYNGVIKKIGKQETVFNMATGLPAQDVRRVFEDSKGNIWFLTRSAGIVKLRNDQIVALYNRSNSLRSNYMLSIEEDKQGNIYLGANGGGLTVISSDGDVKNFPIADDDSGILIFNIYIDEDDQVWVVASTGLHHFDGQNFKLLSIISERQAETYFDWVEDDFGSVWITSNKGIFRMSKSDVLQFVRGELPSVHARMYDNQDGMKSKECTGATYSIKASDGKIWIPTIKGAVVIDPTRLRDNTFVPPVYITSFSGDDKVFSLNQEIKVQPGTLRYTFSFTGLSLMAPQKVKFKYMLEGLDKQWIDADSKREIEYTNLPPGNYSFKVMASNNDGLWNEKPAILSFTVMPYFYQTVAFYIILIVLFGLLLAGAYKWRVSRIEAHNQELRKLNAELDRFVYSASHDLRAPLTSILGLVGLSRIDKENTSSYIDLIEKSVRRLDGFINDIIDYSRNARMEVAAESVNFDSIIKDTFDSLQYLDLENKVSRKISITGDGEFISDRRRISIILTNLISNAIKYHNHYQSSPFVEVKVWKDADKALIQVIDNGTGISKEHHDKIFNMFYRGSTNNKGSGLGLYIVYETVQKLGGKISMSSEPGKGSSFEVTLPASKS